jgi:formate dehydrogenase subunit gamma
VASDGNAPGDIEADTAEAIAGICAAHGNRPDRLIEILHEIQGLEGFIAEAAIPAIAKALNLSRADVHGVVSFYHDFARQPQGRHVIKICRAESCQANGSEALAAHAETTLGIPFGGTTEGGEFSLKAVYCLGNCSLGPSVLVGENLLARMDSDGFDHLVEDLKAK